MLVAIALTPVSAAVLGICMPRIRHCVECPNCRIRYLIAFTPYSNGAYLIPTAEGSKEEYTLYCNCGSGSVKSRWKWREVKACEVSTAAYDRGYGTADEIFLVHQERGAGWDWDLSRYITNWRSMEKRKGSL